MTYRYSGFSVTSCDVMVCVFSGHELHSLHQTQLEDGGPLVRGWTHPRPTALLGLVTSYNYVIQSALHSRMCCRTRRYDVSAGSHAAGLPLANRLRRVVQHVQELHAGRHRATRPAPLLQGKHLLQALAAVVTVCFTHLVVVCRRSSRLSASTRTTTSSG